jgi:hypothetical protein
MNGHVDAPMDEERTDADRAPQLAQSTSQAA